MWQKELSDLVFCSFSVSYQTIPYNHEFTAQWYFSTIVINHLRHISVMYI